MKTINISDDALDGLRRLNVLAQCQTCKSWFIPGHGTEDGTGRRLCPECQPVAPETPALTREWLEHNIRLALPGLSTARVDRLTDHPYGNLAMMQQAQAQGVEP